METERTYIMLKPDAVRRGLVGEIIGRIEKKGFKIVDMKMFYFGGQTSAVYVYHSNAPSLSLSLPLPPLALFLSSMSFFIPLCVH